ncbi:MAG: glutamate--tRNA ligase, partial [Nitrososphaerales archaeon]
LEFYELIREDLRWLSCDWDEEVIQSDRMEIYYEHAEKLLSLGKGYICTCSPSNFKREVGHSKPCKCRQLGPKDNLERWFQMLSDLKEGGAVYRIKTDLKHPNPAIRDWPALRIIDTKKSPHSRTQDRYRVWPLYNFASAIDDHLLQISHIIRGKEHQSNMIKQKYLYDYFGWKYPEYIHYGRLKMDGVELSKSKILEGVYSGTYWGFDDPRLATIASLRRRGYQSSAIRRIIHEIGYKPVDVTVSWELLNSYNRKVIDSTTPRYSVVISPVELLINGVEGPLTVNLPRHPREKSMGVRKIMLDAGSIKVRISKSDVKKITGGNSVRLMGLMNITSGKKVGGKLTAVYSSTEIPQAQKQKLDFINWVYGKKSITVEVIMPDGNAQSCLGEDTLREERVGAIIQLERVGFGRIDDVRLGKEKLAEDSRKAMTIFFTSK